MHLFLQISMYYLSQALTVGVEGLVSDLGILLCREIFIDDFINYNRVRIFRPRRDASVKKHLGFPSI